MSRCLEYIHTLVYYYYFLISVSSHLEKCTEGFKVLQSLHDRTR